MNTIKAILFDLDNTILDRTTTFRNFTQSFLQTYFAHLDSTHDILERIITLDQDGYKDKRELFAELLEELPWKMKPSLNELMDFYNVEYVQNAVLMERAVEVLHHARSKYKTGLITNGRTQIQLGKVEQLGIGDLFDVAVVSEGAGVKKPDPRIFELALGKLDLKPEQFIYVGDHPVNDTEGAAKVGMQTIWMKVNQPWREGVTASPMHTIETLSEIIRLI